MSIVIANSAVRRYEEAYPPDRAGWTDDRTRERIWDSLDHLDAVDLTEADARAIGVLTSADHEAGDRLVLHPERTGILVIRRGMVVTFVGFYGFEQHSRAVSAYGPGLAPTARGIRWVSAAGYWGVPRGRVKVSGRIRAHLENDQARIDDFVRDLASGRIDGLPTRLVEVRHGPDGWVHLHLGGEREDQARAAIGEDAAAIRVTDSDARARIRECCRRGQWTPLDDTGLLWRVTDRDAVVFVAWSGAWYAGQGAPEPVAPEELAAAQLLRELGWTVCREPKWST